MPNKPGRPCRAPGCAELVTGGGYCGTHRQVERTASTERWNKHHRGGKTTERGYGAAWRKLRDSILSREPLCRMCAAEGRTAAANEVDHIVPKEAGGTDDKANLQPLCHDCHLLKTAREDSGAAQSIPRWLKPSAIPLTIVCGPPGAGKSTYVAQAAAKYDLVIDLDDIIDRLRPPGEERAEWLTRGLRYRNSLLGSLCRRPAGSAWFIVGAAKGSEREEWYRLLEPTRIVVMMTPEAVCHERIRRRAREPIGAQITAASRWWRECSPSNVDGEGISKSLESDLRDRFAQPNTHRREIEVSDLGGGR